jgi:hypothetical protein
VSAAVPSPRSASVLPDLAAELAGGRELDLGSAELAADALAGALISGSGPLRLRRAVVTGELALVGARIERPVELLECTFTEVPDLRMAEFTGLALTGCRMPGLQAGNLRVTADLLLNDGFVADGPVHLPDAQIGGSLRLSGGRLHGGGAPALIADRIVVGGTCYARRLRSEGELRLPGGRIAGDLDLAGAELRGSTGDALDITGVSVGGSLHAGRHVGVPGLAFAATGRVLLSGARIVGDLVFSGARIERAAEAGAVADAIQPDRVESRLPPVPVGIIDAGTCVVADRVQVEGNLELDDGLSTDGTIRLPNATVGGYLRLSGARLSGPYGASEHGISLLADGMEVGGDLEGRDHGRGPLVCAGQVRLVGARVRGSASLSGIELAAPDGYALLADRLHVGGEFYLRRLRCQGTIRLNDAEVGATLDCTGARLERPRLRVDGSVRPSLDARAAMIGKDLLCRDGFVAAGGVRLRRTEARKSVQFVDATLVGTPGTGFARYALNAYGLVTTELTFRPGAAPGGTVLLSHARVGTFADSGELWAAERGVDVRGFSYDQLDDTRDVDVRTRLGWLERVMPDFAPGPYEQLAAAYRRAGDEEKAQRVVIARHIRRYSEADPVERVWGALQRLTVGFGYRPWLAVFWLVLFAVLGGAWFAAHPPQPVDSGQNPVFNPWLFAADTLLPIVNLGQDGYWRLDGASQWISSGLVAAGWILATTAAAGAARVLKRA